MIKISKKGKVKEEATNFTLTEIVASAKDRSQAKAKAKLNNGKVHSSSFGNFWSITVKNAGFPPQLMTQNCSVILKACSKRYSEHRSLRNDLPSFSELMVWSVENWRIVMQTAFRKMTNPPLEPALRLWVACVNQFSTMWIDRHKIEKRKTMTTREQLVEEYIEAGQTEQTALRSADEKLGIKPKTEAVQPSKPIQNPSVRFTAVSCREAMQEVKSAKKTSGKADQEVVVKPPVRVRTRLPMDEVVNNLPLEPPSEIPRWE